MGDMRNFNAESPRTVSIDPYALVSAIMGSQVERPREASTMSSTTDGLQADYDELVDMSNDNNDHRGPRPDSPPKDMCVGAANPYALVEAMLGRKIDKTGIDVARILSNVLQTDYDELFDMKHKSVLYAGMRLNEDKRRAERLSSKDIKILTESDLITPDFSQVQKLKDIEQVGLKDLGNARVKLCRMQNGKLRLVLHAHQIGRTVSNHELTRSLNDLTTPFRHGDNKWLPPNASWRDAYDYFFQTFNRRLINEISMFHIGRPDLMDITNLQQNQMLRRGIQYHRFDDPVQGCSTNSWLIAALFSVFWADPCMINRDTRLHSGSSNSGRSHGPCGVFSDDSDDNDGRRHQRRYLAIKFHSQGGDNDNKTRVVEVNYEIPMNNSNNQPIYCRSSDGADIWPSLYEKAFAKWITDTDSEHPDITKTHCGNPVKAMAQINGRTPQYWECDRHRGIDLIGLVRANSVNHKTINPMCAWTYATGQHFRGANIIANHAYSVLGYITQGENQYLVLRNPWGVTEPQGLTAYPGLISQVDPELWTPAALLDHGGLFALEAEAFKNCFQYIGVAR